MADCRAAPRVRVQKSLTTFGLQPIETIRDVIKGLAMWRIWLALAWQEFRSTYRRSMLGVLWVILSFAGFVFVKLTIFSSLLDTGDARYYNTYLVVGFFVWMYLQASITAAPDVFISAQGWIRSEPLPFSLYICKSIMREFYNLALTFVVVVVAIVVLGYPLTIQALWCVPAVLFLMLSAFSYKMLLGLISVRLRDISHLVKAVMMPMMFLTPIFWLPSQMPSLMKYLWWNPLFHFLEIFRAPILDGHVPITSWIFTGVVYLMVTIAAFLMFARFRQRIVFWF